MKGVPAVYLGQIVDKEHFRAFIYGADGARKLVESWDDFEKHMATGIWFSTQEDAANRVPVEAPKRVRNKPVSVMTLELKEEVPDDDFLPKKGE